MEAKAGAFIGEQHVPVVAYADDEVLIATDPVKLQILLNIAYRHSMIWRYRYNATKSKVMVYGAKGNQDRWTLGDDVLEVVEEYTHLGVLMSTRAETRKRIEGAMMKARRAFYARCPTGINISRTSPLTLYTTWKMYAEPILTYSIPVTNICQSEMKYLERMILRMFRMMQGLPRKTQNIVAYVMLGAPTCAVLIMQITMHFIMFLIRAARRHSLTRYVMLHGAVNQDRKSSITRNWDRILEELKLPKLEEIMGVEQGKCTKKTCSQAIMKRMKEEITETVSGMESVQWLKEIADEMTSLSPPASFWSENRYSNIGRLATATRIKLLTGHSRLLTGINRRHKEENTVCPLCMKAVETLEHMLFECSELEQQRKTAEEKYGNKLRRNRSGSSLILHASRKEALMIHYIYASRVQIELMSCSGNLK